jgi:hypothetical protein
MRGEGDVTMTEKEPERTGGSKSAVILLGCPQVPVQTSVALFLLHALKSKGITTLIAGNRAARMLLEVADPAHHYCGAMLDLDAYMADLAEGRRDADLTFAFIHNDAGVVYATTAGSLSRGSLIAVVYGEHFDEVAASITVKCEKIAAKAVHNPMPLARKIEEVLPWVVSNL